MSNKLETVGDYIEALKKYPREWPVNVATPAGGGIAIEHREIEGKPVIAVFGSNGGRFGENPLTGDEYEKVSKEFMRMWESPYFTYTSIHGDHRMYRLGGINATCYGTHFDRRIIERMVEEGLIQASEVDIERVKSLGR